MVNYMYCSSKRPEFWAQHTQWQLTDALTSALEESVPSSGMNVLPVSLCLCLSVSLSLCVFVSLCVSNSHFFSPSLPLTIERKKGERKERRKEGMRQGTNERKKEGRKRRK